VTPSIRGGFTTAVLVFAAVTAHAEPSPSTAAALSVIIPGLGQATQGDYTAAAEHFSLFAASLAAGAYYQRKPDLLSDDDRYQHDREIVNQTTLRRDFALRVATDTALYSSFAAYRDGRSRDTRLYRTPAPKESLSDLAVAPFSWEYLSRPTTFIPLGLQLIAAASDHYGVYRQPDVSTNALYANELVANEFTAVGEEGFFRGFLNNEFSDRWGNGWGLVGSSTIFGLAHSGQGQTANAFQAGLAGAYLGWVQQRNNFQIGEGVAIHYWINVIAGIAAIRHGGSAQLVSFSLPF
jgi:hypothetical protein